MALTDSYEFFSILLQNRQEKLNFNLKKKKNQNCLRSKKAIHFCHAPKKGKEAKKIQGYFDNFWSENNSKRESIINKN